MREVVRGVVRGTARPSVLGVTIIAPGPSSLRMPHLTNDYRIEKTRCRVAVTTVDGERFVGDVFLQSFTPRGVGPESPAELLNADDPFFPMVLPEGGALLLSKERLREVELPDDPAAVPEDPYIAPGVRHATVELTLLGNVVRSGSIRMELPHDRPRLLDFFNRFSQRFLTLSTEDGVRLVNRRCIERVRPVDV